MILGQAQPYCVKNTTGNSYLALIKLLNKVYHLSLETHIKEVACSVCTQKLAHRPGAGSCSKFGEVVERAKKQMI